MFFRCVSTSINHKFPHSLPHSLPPSLPHSLTHSRPHMQATASCSPTPRWWCATCRWWVSGRRRRGARWWTRTCASTSTTDRAGRGECGWVVLCMRVLMRGMGGGWCSDWALMVNANLYMHLIPSPLPLPTLPTIQPSPIPPLTPSSSPSPQGRRLSGVPGHRHHHLPDTGG